VIRIPGVEQRYDDRFVQFSQSSTTGTDAQQNGQSLLGTANMPEIFHADIVEAQALHGQPDGLRSRKVGGRSRPVAAPSSSSSLVTDRSKFLARHASSEHESA